MSPDHAQKSGDFESGVSAHSQPREDAAAVAPEDALQDLLHRIGSGAEEDPQAALAQLNAQASASHGLDIGGLLDGLLGRATQQDKPPAKQPGSGSSADLAPALKRIAEALGVSPSVVEQLAPALGGLLGGAQQQEKKPAARSTGQASRKSSAQPPASGGTRRKAGPKADTESKPRKRSSGSADAAPKKPKTAAKPKPEAKPKPATKSKPAAKPKPAAKSGSSGVSSGVGGSSTATRKRTPKPDENPWSAS